MNNISNEGKQDLIETYSKTTQMGKNDKTWALLTNEHY